MPSKIRGTCSRLQKRGSRFGDIRGTSLFGAWTGGSNGHAASDSRGPAVFATTQVRTTMASPTVPSIWIVCGIAVWNGGDS